MCGFDLTDIAGCEIIGEVGKDEDGIEIDDESDEWCFWDKGSFVFGDGLMVLENCDFLEDYHVDFRKDLGSDGD